MSPYDPGLAVAPAVMRVDSAYSWKVPCLSGGCCTWYLVQKDDSVHRTTFRSIVSLHFTKCPAAMLCVAKLLCVNTRPRCHLLRSSLEPSFGPTASCCARTTLEEQNAWYLGGGATNASATWDVTDTYYPKRILLAYTHWSPC